MMEWDSFVLYTSQYDLIKDLSYEQLGRLLHAIYRYNLGEEVSIDNDKALAMAFGFIRRDIARAHANRLHICEVNSENGKKGGAPKGVCNNPNGRRGNKPEQSETNRNKAKQTGTKPNVNVNGNVNVNVNGNGNEIDTPLCPPGGGNDSPAVKKPGKAKKFSPPTREDVDAYVKDGGYSHVDVDAFMDNYEANGWMTGRNKMKDWKAAVRTWERNQIRWQSERGQQERREKPSEIGRILYDGDHTDYTKGAW